MSLIVEDGTGIVDAESYCTVAFADTYHVARGNETTWRDQDKPVKEIALRKATEYIDLRFGSRFKGSVEFPDTPQALLFPRIDIEGYTDVPICLQRAVAEYALRSLTTALAPDPTADATGRAVAFRSEKVGPIQEKTGYFNVVSPFSSYPLADALLRPLLIYTGGVTR